MSSAFGEIRQFPQKNGPDVQLRVFGDEFYARYENLQGYTCVDDEAKGRHCYAALKDGAFESTGIPLDAPPPAGLPQHLKEAPYVRNEHFDDRFGALQPPPLVAEEETLEVLGPNRGLLNGRQLHKGKVRGLAIMVDFEDVQTTISADDVRAMLNDDNCKANGNYCSVRESSASCPVAYWTSRTRWWARSGSAASAATTSITCW